MPQSPAAQLPRGAAVYLAFVQFFFVTTWTIYVIYLPQLLKSIGLPPTYAPWILIFDQLVFMVMDVVMGVAADRARRSLGRIGGLIVGATALSCIAFLFLPHISMLGAAAPAVGLGLLIVWTATSSALRAPPWVLLSKYAAKPSLPWVNALALSGIALGGAIAPYLGVTLKNVDPRLPFALSSATLLATTVGLIWVERALAGRAPAVVEAAPETKRLLAGLSLFLIACLLLALGFQIHFSLNSSAQYLRFAKAAQLEYLMPVFWIGFNVAMFPGAALAKRYGTLEVMAASAVAAAVGGYLSSQAPNLDALVAAQLLAGGAWGCMLMAAFSAVLAFGRTGREGMALGLLFAVLAFATLSRITVVAAQLNKDPAFVALLAWAPAVLWLAGALMLLFLAIRNPFKETHEQTH